MNWESRYVAPDPAPWQGRSDSPADSCFFQHIKLLNLLSDKPQKTAPLTFALLGFKCDEGVQRDLGRTGAFEGPTAIRQRIAKLPIQIPSIHCYDAGNVICTDHDLEASQAALGEVVEKLLAVEMIPIVLGGGHEVAYGNFLGISKTLAIEKRLGIINFDAHFDLQPLQPSMRSSSKTTFWQIAHLIKEQKRQFDFNCIGIQHVGNVRQTFELAKKKHVNVILADELHQGLQEKCFDFIDRIIDQNEYIYLSLSMDVFSPAFAPGVSSIQPLGLTPWQVIPLVRQAASSGKVLSYDLSELVPRYDIDHRTAKLAASFVYEIIHHHHVVHDHHA